MKKYFLLALVLLTVGAAYPGDQKNVKPQIKQVTVFLNRAQISSTANAYIEEGLTDVILEGLPASVEPQSIQVSGKGEFIIMAVKHSLNYLDPLKKSRDIEVLEDSIEGIQLELDILKSTKEVFSKEEQMILANQSIKGEETGLTAEALEEMADFYRERLTEIRTEILTGEISIRKVNERLQKYKNQLNALRKLANQPTSQIAVTVSNKSAKNAILEVNYIVNNAGWYPLYDLRAKDTKSPVQLMYKAQVYQHTGSDWKNVKLKLSTANPSLGGTKPDLTAWYLNIYNPVYRSSKNSEKAKKSMAPSMEREVYEEMDDAGYIHGLDVKKEAKSIADYTTVVETSMAAEFDIAIPYSIPTGGEGQLVDIQTHQLPATYRHFAVPKLDKDAFLTANVTGWDGLNLLSGDANIYFEGTYVGQSYLDLQNTSDTLSLSLGRDNKVVVERKNLKDFSSKKLIGTNKKEEYAYEIVVRNSKKDAIEITLEDQMPVSQNSEIEVEVLETGGAEYDVVTGKLVWKLSLNPSETKSVKFKYSVKYPKNKRVTGL